MSSRADQHQIRRWQEDVASDPASTSFLPLAEIYRREGRVAVARRLLTRGLKRYPDNVDAHFLLGRLCKDLGDVHEARAQWEAVLEIEANHLPSIRSLGFLHLERGEWSRAAMQLERIEAAGVADERVEAALAVARAQGNGRAATSAPPESIEVAVEAPFRRFLQKSRVRRVLLSDSTGRVLAQHGFGEGVDLAAFASLGAAIQAASTAIARMLGQRRFDQLYQGAGERQLFLAPVQTPGGEMNLLLAFGSETTIGLVRVYFRELATEIARLPSVATPSPAPHNAAAFEARLLSSVEIAARPGGSRIPR
jgi:tetratricopeptide (TPR) repeat protein